MLGERVEAFDDEGLAFMGAVAEVGGRFAYLRMEWNTAHVDHDGVWPDRSAAP